jgi:hypothetical protein
MVSKVTFYVDSDGKKTENAATVEKVYTTALSAPTRSSTATAITIPSQEEPSPLAIKSVRRSPFHILVQRAGAEGQRREDDEENDDDNRHSSCDDNQQEHHHHGNRGKYRYSNGDYDYSSNSSFGWSTHPRSSHSSVPNHRTLSNNATSSAGIAGGDEDYSNYMHQFQNHDNGDYSSHDAQKYHSSKQEGKRNTAIVAGFQRQHQHHHCGDDMRISKNQNAHGGVRGMISDACRTPGKDPHQEFSENPHTNGQKGNTGNCKTSLKEHHPSPPLLLTGIQGQQQQELHAGDPTSLGSSTFGRSSTPSTRNMTSAVNQPVSVASSSIPQPAIELLVLKRQVENPSLIFTPSYSYHTSSNPHIPVMHPNGYTNYPMTKNRDLHPVHFHNDNGGPIHPLDTTNDPRQIHKEERGCQEEQLQHNNKECSPPSKIKGDNNESSFSLKNKLNKSDGDKEDGQEDEDHRKNKEHYYKPNLCCGKVCYRCTSYSPKYVKSIITEYKYKRQEKIIQHYHKKKTSKKKWREKIKIYQQHENGTFTPIIRLLPGYRPILECDLKAIYNHGTEYGLLYPIPNKMKFTAKDVLKPVGGVPNVTGGRGISWAYVEAKRFARHKKQQLQILDGGIPKKDDLVNKKMSTEISTDVHSQDKVEEKDSKDTIKHSVVARSGNGNNKLGNFYSNDGGINITEYGNFLRGMSISRKGNKRKISSNLFRYTKPKVLGLLTKKNCISDCLNEREDASDRCKKCLRRFVLGGVLVDAKSNVFKDCMDELYEKKHFQVPRGYKMLEKEHINAIIENGKDFGITFPIPVKLNPLAISSLTTSYRLATKKSFAEDCGLK